MKGSFLSMLMIYSIMASSCTNDNPKETATSPEKEPVKAGSFGYDLHFLQQHDSIVVLETDSGLAKIIVSPKYQAKVFTSTAAGESGLSFGWVNYKAFASSSDPHMNAYGGENRIWLGPEGGKFSLFFKPGAAMEFANWKTPASFDSESWQVTAKSSGSVAMQKHMDLTNYQGSRLQLLADRSVTILSRDDISRSVSLPPGSNVKAVGYTTDNKITNEGKTAWNEKTGMPCIWILDMFRPTDKTVIVVPYQKGAAGNFEKAVTAIYFGEIKSDRLKHTDNHLFFRADGKSRGKLGVSPASAKTSIGSYDALNKLLTVIVYDVDSSSKYLNQRWNTTDPSFAGDAVNAYNDGPLADGSQMGPFYELESVSPAAFLQPGKSIAHKHTVYHFTGEEQYLEPIAQHFLYVSLKEIRQAF